jgi:Putative transmembrane protein (PGPGW)
LCIPDISLRAEVSGAEIGGDDLRDNRFIVLFVGGGLLIIALAMLIVPGRAIVFIPLALAILTTEFKWAKNWLISARQWMRVRFQKTNRAKAKR